MKNSLTLSFHQKRFQKIEAIVPDQEALISISKLSKKIKRKEKYDKITEEQKKKLIDDIINQKISLQQASELNNLNINSAKFIWQQFRNSNKDLNRKIRVVKKDLLKIQKKEISGPIFHSKAINVNNNYQNIITQQLITFSAKDATSTSNSNNTNQQNIEQFQQQSSNKNQMEIENNINNILTKFNTEAKNEGNLKEKLINLIDVLQNIVKTF